MKWRNKYVRDRRKYTEIVFLVLVFFLVLFLVFFLNFDIPFFLKYIIISWNFIMSEKLFLKLFNITFLIKKKCNVEESKI